MVIIHIGCQKLALWKIKNSALDTHSENMLIVSLLQRIQFSNGSLHKEQGKLAFCLFGKLYIGYLRIHILIRKLRYNKQDGH